jgi:hypothetical protein
MSELERLALLLQDLGHVEGRREGAAGICELAAKEDASGTFSLLGMALKDEDRTVRRDSAAALTNIFLNAQPHINLREILGLFRNDDSAIRNGSVRAVKDALNRNFDIHELLPLLAERLEDSDSTVMWDAKTTLEIYVKKSDNLGAIGNVRQAVEGKKHSKELISLIETKVGAILADLLEKKRLGPPLEKQPLPKPPTGQRKSPLKG